MYYIGTKSQCEYYLNKVNQGEQYNGVTSKWAQIRSSYTEPKQYAILKHPKYTHSNMQLVETLPAEFTPPQTDI